MEKRAFPTLFVSVCVRVGVCVGVGVRMGVGRPFLNDIVTPRHLFLMRRVRTGVNRLLTYDLIQIVKHVHLRLSEFSELETWNEKKGEKMK